MRILALEPFYAGSHRYFLDGWIQHSRHEWTVLGLPGHKWKWRMRHAPVTLAEQTAELVASGGVWDAVFCSDMLNLAEYLSLAPQSVRDLPSVVYFHENQFTYPTRTNDKRDHHYGFTNYITALTADRVWFNSEFHRREFLTATKKFLMRMPDYRGVENVDAIERKSSVHYPGVFAVPSLQSALEIECTDRDREPFRILWASRWEFDKNPEEFFEAIGILEQEGVDYRLYVLGEAFENSPDIFEAARQEFSHRIEEWGFVKDKLRYGKILANADVIVSTAFHEFFGVAVVEAIMAGATPVLPNRLAYPEVLSHFTERSAYLYEGGAIALASLLLDVIYGTVPRLESGCTTFEWGILAEVMDEAMTFSSRCL